MAQVGARGAVSLTAVGGDGDAYGSSMWDTNTPAGWFHIFWWASVFIILFLLWAL